MLGSLYTYGHLVAGPLALGLSLAFAMIGWRVPSLRRDLGLAVIFTATGAVTFMQFGMVRVGTVAWARLYVASVHVLHVATVVLIYRIYGREVLAAERRRRAAILVVVFVAADAVMASMLFAGVLDDGVRWIDVAGIHAPMLRAGLDQAIPNVLFLIGGQMFSLWILTRPGPWKQERTIFAVPILLAPLPVIHEQLVTLGWLDAPPMGGYFTALAGLVGAWILAEHVRALSDAPRRIANFEVVRKLGAGGLAQVWLAQRRGGGAMGSVTQMVALKRLRPELAEDPQFVKMFLEEARLVAKLRHPHIVPLLEAGSTEQGVYLAMELVEGPSLAAVLAYLVEHGDRLPPAAVIEIGAQLGEALAYAHELTTDDGRALRIVHRDVSPHNVLVSRTGHVKLTDFGIALSVEKTSHTQTGVIKGKLRYMPPEQIKGESYDHRVDVYALGVVLVELATGKPRYPGQNDVQVLYQVIQGKDDDTVLDAVPAPLAEVLRRAIDRDPERRVASASRMVAELSPLRQPAEGVAILARLAAEVPDAPASEPTSLPFEETQVAGSKG